MRSQNKEKSLKKIESKNKSVVYWFLASTLLMFDLR
jgi:hypothetical protein